ncbi:MAG: AAA family ATPase [Clostridia bacterium]|nr:AAA family ATPase [Clostridia bacterium]
MPTNESSTISGETNVFPDKTSALRLFFKGFITPMACPEDFGKSLALSRAKERILQGDGTRPGRPVLYLDLSSVHPRTYRAFLGSMKAIIAELYRHHEAECLPLCRFYEPKLYSGIISGEADKLDYMDAIDFLARLMHKRYGSTPVVIIDGADTPLLYALSGGYYEKAHAFISHMYGTMNDNRDIKKCLMSGTTYMNHCSLHGGHYLMDNCLPSSLRYSLGFSVRETVDILASYGRADKLDEVLFWYGGYLTEEGEKVCPGSLAAYIRGGFTPGCYRKNTFLDIYGRQAYAGEKFHGWLTQLLTGPLQIIIPRNICYGDLATDEGMLSVMCHYGYLDIRSAVPADDFFYELKCDIAVPNQEARSLIHDLIR